MLNEEVVKKCGQWHTAIPQLNTASFMLQKVIITYSGDELYEKTSIGDKWDPGTWTLDPGPWVPFVTNRCLLVKFIAAVCIDDFLQHEGSSIQWRLIKIMG